MATRTAGKRRQESRKDPPVWSKRVWTGSGQVEVNVWRSTVGEGDAEREVLNTTIRKTYKKENEYAESRSYRSEELPIIAALLHEAFVYSINAANGHQTEGRTTDDEVPY